VQELRSRGGRGYTYIDDHFLPALGVDDATVRLLRVENPRRWLTIG
jgi:predicted metal-dependent phosphotriesterase family hydrolase